MIAKLAAIIASASCAGVVVTFIPAFAPETASGATQQAEPSLRVAAVITAAEAATPSAEDIRKAAENNIRNGSRDRKIACTQSWPYYENSCLHNLRPAGSAPRMVRVIAADRSTAVRSRRATHGE